MYLDETNLIGKIPWKTIKWSGANISISATYGGDVRRACGSDTPTLALESHDLYETKKDPMFMEDYQKLKEIKSNNEVVVAYDLQGNKVKMRIAYLRLHPSGGETSTIHLRLGFAFGQQ